MQPMLNIAIRAARKAGNTIIRAADRTYALKVTEKTANDFVTEVDHQAEQDIIQVIRKAYPSHAILAEETGQSGDNEYQWIIDPLDGTTNFLHGLPLFAVSIALQHKNVLEHAVIYNPVSDELYTASRGSGAQLNDRRIRVNQRNSLQGALLGTGIPFRDDQDLDFYLKTLKALIPGTAGIRRPGSAALDLAFVAAGRYDGFWEMGLQPWDMAAGILIVQEAGGIVSDILDQAHPFKTGNIVAGNIKIHAAMLKKLQAVQQQNTL